MARTASRIKRLLPYETRRRRRRVVAYTGLFVSLAFLALSLVQMAGLSAGLSSSGQALAQDVVRPGNAVNVPTPGAAPDAVEGRVPGNALGSTSDSGLWRGVRNGEQYSVSIPNKIAGILVQSDGEEWRALRNGPLKSYFVYGLAGIFVLLAALSGWD